MRTCPVAIARTSLLRSGVAAAALCAMLGATLGMAAAQTQPPAPPARSETNSAPHPSNTAASPEQQRQGEATVQSKSGQGGKEEPSTKPAARDTSAVLMDGRLNVPGAPEDSQTVPSKYSKRNAALDALPTLAFPLGLNDQERVRLANDIRAANAPVAQIKAQLTQELPLEVTLHELPASAAGMNGLAHLKYVRLSDRILLVSPPNRIVVGEIKG